MILTDMNKHLKMLVDETRGSFGSPENKKRAVPTFAVVVRKVLLCEWGGIPHILTGTPKSRENLWLVSPSDKSRKFLGGSFSFSLYSLQP